MRGWIGRKILQVYAYWCPNCKRRFRTEKKFRKHYYPCEDNRLRLIQENKERVMKKYNRKQRRKMGLYE